MSRCDKYSPEPQPSLSSVGACCRDVFKAPCSRKDLIDTFTSSHNVNRGVVDGNQLFCSFTEWKQFSWTAAYWALLWINALLYVSGFRSMWCTLWLRHCQHAYTSVSAMDKRTGEYQQCCFCDDIIGIGALSLCLFKTAWSSISV